MGNSKLLISAAAVIVFGIASPSFASNNNQHGQSGDTTTIKDSFNKVVTNTKNDVDVDVDVRLTKTNEHNGNVKIVADQQLGQSISNESRMNFDGKRSDYSSGSNSVRGSAFAAYSGILNQGWNTGINSNAQAATNIAAQGQTTFSNR